MTMGGSDPTVRELRSLTSTASGEPQTRVASPRNGGGVADAPTARAMTATTQRIAFDISRMRPGCVLVQAAMGCDSTVAHEFPVETWLLAPTDEMRVYPITNEQLAVLVARVSANTEVA